MTCAREERAIATTIGNAAGRVCPDQAEGAPTIGRRTICVARLIGVADPMRYR
jgi:hypothetical protein